MMNPEFTMASPEQNSPMDVCLVLMPYADLNRPSIALGLLQAACKANGIQAKSIYANLWLAEQIGLDAYQLLCQRDPSCPLAEWTFSGHLFPHFQSSPNALIDALGVDSAERADFEERLWEIREQCGLFLDQLAARIVAMQPKIVSCSSMFQQHCASLALLKRIHELAPTIITIIGGANCEGLMGQATHREFPWVDYVCSGEGDDHFPRLCSLALHEGRDIDASHLPYGVIGSSNHGLLSKSSSEPPRASVSELDHLPIPIYDDYFTALSQSYLSTFIHPGLPIETSRGCWWGQKKHCTFCGLNGGGMTYRSKSPERVIREFASLAERYGITKFQVVDNILDMGHINTVLPVFASLEKAYQIFYETKANLRRTQLKTLADAGVLWLQPGIEGMHDAVLRLLNKGNTALMNIQFLKWARELGQVVYWNFLMGAPGEQDAWYAETMSWLPLVVHLQPPSFCGWIRYDRFSPYFQNPEQWGLSLIPNKLYQLIYPLDQERLADLVYFFEDQGQALLSRSSLTVFHQTSFSGRLRVQSWCSKWSALFRPSSAPTLTMTDTGTHLHLQDSRPCALAAEVCLEGLARHVYLACDRALTGSEILRQLQTSPCDPQIHLGKEELDAVLNQLCAKRLMLQLDGRYLSLALQGPVPPLPSAENAPSGSVDLDGFRCFMEEQMALASRSAA